MAFVLFRLGLALHFGSLKRAGGVHRVGFVVGWLAAVVVGVAGAELMRFLAGAGLPTFDVLVVMLHTAVFIGWAVTPLALPDLVDSTVDPEALAIYPLSRREQVGGLLLGGLITPPAMATFVFSAGVALASGEPFEIRALFFLSAILFTLLCVTSCRAVQAIAVHVISTSRGRDVAIGGTAVVFSCFAVIAHSVQASDFGPQLLTPVGYVLSWLPPGAAVEMGIHARDGQWLLAAASGLIACAAIAAMAWAWGWALELHTRGGGGGGKRQVSRDMSGLALIPAAMGALPLTVVTVAAAQQLRYFLFRSPRAVQALALPPVGGVIVAHSLGAQFGLMVTAAAFAMMAAQSATTNVFGSDGPGMEYLVLTGVRLRDVFLGKVLAPAVFIVPAMVLLVVIEAAITSRWGQVLPAVVTGVAALCLSIGIGAIHSVLAAFDRDQASRRRGRATSGLLLALFVNFVVLGLSIWVWVLLDDSVPTLLLAFLALLVGIGFAFSCIVMAGRRLDARPLRIRDAITHAE